MPVEIDKKPETKLHLPQNFAYDCVMCGRGCSDFWEIPVDEVSEKRLEKYDLKPYQQRLKDQPYFVQNKDDEGRSICRENDVCTFLKEDQSCALHIALGPKEKPQACIDFPFRYVDTPGGTYVGLSFACTAVLQKHGRMVEERREDLETEYRHSIHKRNASRRVQLTRRISLDFDAYLELENVFAEILELEKVSLNHRLHTISQFFEIVEAAFRASRLMGESDVELSVDEQLAAQQAKDIEIIRGLANRFRQDHWAKLLARGIRQAKAPATHRAFIGLVTTFRQALWRGASRLTASWYIFRHYLSAALRLGSIALKPMEQKISYRELKDNWPEADPKSSWEILQTRYFQHYLFRKDLILAESLQSGIQFMLLQYSLMNWYLAAYRKCWGKDHTEQEIEHEALRTVEKYYINHSRFIEYLEHQPLLATFLETIMNGKTYGASMTGPPFKAKDTGFESL